MRTNLSVGIFLLALGATSCSGSSPTEPLAKIPKFTCIANSQTMRLPAEIRATLPPFKHGEPDDQFVAISRSAPGGFAGYFIDNGRQVLTFTDTATADAHRAEIQDVFNANVPQYGSAPNVATAEIRGARWTFAELGEWWQYILPNLNVGGVSTIDIDEKANTIAFGVIDEASRARLEAKLASLSISCNLVTTVIQGYATAVNRVSTASP